MASASGLIRYFAHLYGGQCEIDDLFQIGNLAVLKALKSYDPGKGASFLTYASHCIIGDIRHAVRKQTSYYRPGCIIALQSKVNQFIDEYLQIHGELPAIEIIAHKLHLTADSVQDVMKAGLMNFEEIEEGKIRNSEYVTFQLPIEDKLILYQAIRKLSELQKRVIHMLFYRNMSQQEVADQLGITQKQVSRLKEKSMTVLRNDLAGDPPVRKHSGRGEHGDG